MGWARNLQKAIEAGDIEAAEVEARRLTTHDPGVTAAFNAFAAMSGYNADWDIVLYHALKGRDYPADSIYMALNDAVRRGNLSMALQLAEQKDLCREGGYSDIQQPLEYIAENDTHHGPEWAKLVSKLVKGRRFFTSDINQGLNRALAYNNMFMAVALSKHPDIDVSHEKICRDLFPIVNSMSGTILRNALNNKVLYISNALTYLKLSAHHKNAYTAMAVVSHPDFECEDQEYSAVMQKIERLAEYMKGWSEVLDVAHALRIQDVSLKELGY